MDYVRNETRLRCPQEISKFDRDEPDDIVGISTRNYSHICHLYVRGT